MAQKSGDVYKMTYFNAAAKGETIRMLLKLANQDFEDIRVERQEWPKLKPKTPFGQLPMFEYNGKVLCQTRAIERMLAKKYGFYGDSEEEQVHADMVTDTLSDMHIPVRNIKFAEGDEQVTLRKKYMEETGPTHYGNLEKMIKEGGYTNGQKVSWPDLALYNAIEFAKAAAGVDMNQMLSATPRIRALHHNVQTQPEIAQWLKQRPKVQF